MVIFGYKLSTLFKKTLSEIREDNVLTLAASSAYNFFFSLFPLFLFLAPMLSFLGKKEEMVNGVLASLAPIRYHGTGRPVGRGPCGVSC